MADITFDYAPYDGVFTLEPADADDDLTFDFAPYDGVFSLEEAAAAAGQPFIKRFGGIPFAASLGRGVW